jgi:hypothetical protein
MCVSYKFAHLLVSDGEGSEVQTYFATQCVFAPRDAPYSHGQIPADFNVDRTLELFDLCISGEQIRDLVFRNFGMDQSMDEGTFVDAEVNEAVYNNPSSSWEHSCTFSASSPASLAACTYNSLVPAPAAPSLSSPHRFRLLRSSDCLLRPRAHPVRHSPLFTYKRSRAWADLRGDLRLVAVP